MHHVAAQLQREHQGMTPIKNGVNTNLSMLVLVNLCIRIYNKYATTDLRFPKTTWLDLAS